MRESTWWSVPGAKAEVATSWGGGTMGGGVRVEGLVRNHRHLTNGFKPVLKPI